MNLEPLSLVKEAERHDGHCGTCGQTIKIYRYTVNRSMAIFLRRAAEQVEVLGENRVDVSILGLAYSIRTQVTKLRLHGLIARVKNADGAQVANHWLITKKGWSFINGQPIPKKVVVYDNKVLGHEGGNITIYEVMGEATPPADEFGSEAITPAESKVYGDARTPKRTMTLMAQSKKTDITNELVIERLELGRPIVVLKINGEEAGWKYKDIAAFQKDWEIIK